MTSSSDPGGQKPSNESAFKRVFNRIKKPLKILALIYVVLIVIATSLSFAPVRAFFHPLVSLLEADRTFVIRDFCPVYTTQEKPVFVIDSRKFGNYEFRVIKASDVFRLSADVQNPDLYARIVRRDYDYDFKPLFEANSHFTGVGAVARVSGTVGSIDADRSSTVVTLPALPPGDYIGILGTPNQAQKADETSFVRFKVTNLGAIAKHDSEKLLVSTIDLLSRKPWANAEVTLLKDGFFPEGSRACTSENGLLTILRPREMSKQDWDSVSLDITSKGHSAFFGTHPGFNYHRPSDGTDHYGNFATYISSRYRMFVDTDRPVYRLGQTINFKGYVRKVTANGIATPASGTAIDMMIMGPEGNEVRHEALHLDSSGTFVGCIKASESTKTGQYVLNFTYPDQNVETFTVLVDQYRKPDFKVDVVPVEARYASGDKARFKIQANYYFGAPLKDAKISYRVSAQTDLESKEKLKNKHTADGDFFKAWGSNYYWYRSDVPFNKEGELLTDGSGQAFLEFDLPKATQLKQDGPYSYDYLDRIFTVQVDATDQSRKTFSAEGAVPVSRGDFALSIANRDSTFLKAGSPIDVNVTASDYDGRPVPAKNITIKLVRWTWEQAPFSEGKYTSREIAVLNKTTDASGVARVSFPTRTDFSSDSYYITAEAVDDEKRVIGDVSQVWLFGSGNQYHFADRSPDEQFKIELDRAVYKPGETLKSIIRAPLKEGEEAYVLVTIEGCAVRAFKQIKMSGPVAPVEFPIDASYMPNAYISAAFVMPGHRPFNTSSLVKVSPASKIVRVSVSSDKPTVKPGQTVKYTVVAKNENDLPVPNFAISASVVDEGIFAVCHDLKKTMYLDGGYGDICHSLYRMIENEVSTQFSFGEYFAGTVTKPPVFDGIGLLMLHGPILSLLPGADRYACQDSAMLARGAMESKSAMPMATPTAAPAALREEGRPAQGAGGAPPKQSSPPAPRVRSNFLDTAAWFPSVVTGTNGSASFSVKLPDDLTTWRATVSGVTSASAVGTGSVSVIATQDFLARLALPRFYTQYDETTISGLIHNLSSVDQSVNVSLSVSPNIKLLEPSVVAVQVPKDSIKRQSWKVQVVAPGEAKVTLKAIGGKFADAEERKLPVRTFGYRAYFAKNGVIKDDVAIKNFPLKFPPDAKLNTGFFELNGSSSTIGPVLGNFGQLIDYPYGCTEQTLSKMIPSVVAKRISTNLKVSLAPETETIFRNANVEALAKLSDYQHDDGGWGWWKDDNSDPYMTAHVLEGFYLLRAAGVAVDEGRVERGREYLSMQIQTLVQSPWDTYQSENHAKAVYVASLYGSALDPITRTWQLINLKKMTPEALSYLTMAFRNVKDDHAARETYARLVQLRNDSLEYSSWDHTSDLLAKLGTTGGWDYTYRFTGVETTALALRATVMMEPDNEELIDRISRWLVVQRDEKGWSNTKATTAVYLALLEKELANKPDRRTNFVARIEALNKVCADLKFQKTFENRQQAAVVPLASGISSVKLEKNGPGWLYYSTLLSYDRPLKPGEQPILKSLPADLKIRRELFKLVRAEQVKNRETRYRAVPLNKGDTVKAGDMIKMKITVDCPISVPYAMVEAFLPSGGEVLDAPPPMVQENVPAAGEPAGKGAVEADVAIASRWYWWTHQDVLDDRIAFFATELAPGPCQFEAYLRMEMPGKFNINPVNMEAMYTNKIRGRSAAHDVTVVE